MNILSKRLRQSLLSPSFSSTKKSQFFHPSSVSVETDKNGYHQVIGACLREQYYRITNTAVTNSIEPDYMISAMLGDKASALIVELIDTHGFKMGLQRLAVELSFYDPRINVSGRTDIMAWDYLLNEPVGIEIKSVGKYKADLCIDKPDDCHVMQSMLYLDYYRTYMPPEQKCPNKWYIWYISRSESWAVKGKKHGSDMTMLWDFYITMDEEGIPTVHTATNAIRRPDLKLSNIHDRYLKLATALSNNTIPNRDYDYQYSEEKLAQMFKLDLLTRKIDKEKIEKWIKKGAPEGKLNLDMGDFECRNCAYRDECWGLKSNNTPMQFSSLPLHDSTTGQEESKVDSEGMW